MASSYTQFQRVSSGELHIPGPHNETLALIRPGDSKFFQTMIDNESVHPFMNVDDLQRHRIGNADMTNLLGKGARSDNKLTWGLIGNLNGEPVLRATLSSQLMRLPENETGSINPVNFPGDMHNMLYTPSRPIAEPEGINTIIFYSITNVQNDADPQSRGAGGRLISSVYGLLQNERPLLMSTLSPFRGFGSWLKKQTGDADISEDLMIDYALAYVLTRENRIQKFHMGNGAVISNVRPKANAADSIDATEGANMSANYVYVRAPENLARFQSDYAQGVVTMSEHLLEETLVTRRKNIAEILKAAGHQKPCVVAACGADVYYANAATSLNGDQAFTPETLAL